MTSKKWIFRAFLTILIFNFYLVMPSIATRIIALLIFIMVTGVAISSILFSKTRNRSEDFTQQISISFSMVISCGIACLFIQAIVTNQFMMLVPRAFFGLMAQITANVVLIVALFLQKFYPPLTQNNIFNQRNPWQVQIAFYISLVLPLMALLTARFLDAGSISKFPQLVLITIGIILITLWRYSDDSHDWMISGVLTLVTLALILMSSTRGFGPIGTDASKEFYLATRVFEKGIWIPRDINDAYFSSLGITLFPSNLAALLHLPVAEVFQYVLPALTSIIPAQIFSLVKQYRSRSIAISAAVLFISQPSFLVWSIAPLRQLIAMIFFSGFLLVQFSREGAYVFRRTLIVIFGILTILTHYSSTYLMLFTLALGWIFQVIQQKRNKIDAHDFFIHKRTLFILLITTFIWYGPITYAYTGLSGTLNRSFGLVADEKFNPFNPEGYAPSTNLLAQLGLDSEEIPSQILLDRSSQEFAEKTIFKNPELFLSPTYVQVSEIQSRNKVPSPILSISDFLSKEILRFAFIFGLLVLLRRSLRKNLSIFELYAIAAGISILLIVIFPDVSISYSLGRTSHQMFALISILITCWRYKRPNVISLGVMLIAFPLYVNASGLSGLYPNVLTSNRGPVYENSYVHLGELLATNWIASKNSDLVASGYFSSTKFYYSGMERPPIYRDVFPFALLKDGYLFRGKNEISSSLATTYYEGKVLKYAYPSSILNEKRSILFNSGEAIVYGSWKPNE